MASNEVSCTFFQEPNGKKSACASQQLNQSSGYSRIMAVRSIEWFKWIYVSIFGFSSIRMQDAVTFYLLITSPKVKMVNYSIRKYQKKKNRHNRPTNIFELVKIPNNATFKRKTKRIGCFLSFFLQKIQIWIFNSNKWSLWHNVNRNRFLFIRFTCFACQIESFQ